MKDEMLYEEKLTSNRTMILFLAITLITGFLFFRRQSTHGMDLLAWVWLIFAVFFLFYTLNYHTLTIRINAQTLRVTFGIITWRVPLENIDSCQVDKIHAYQRQGGAGIHFMLVEHRYRASFNFLEYPRVVIAFKRKVGPVRDLSFSTRKPEEVMRWVSPPLLPPFEIPN